MSKLDNPPAKWPVIQEWDAWSKLNPKDAGMMNGMLFFIHLQSNRPSLLSFKSKGDKWQTVHGWLLRERRVAS
jgi:hypothetical protein